MFKKMNTEGEVCPICKTKKQKPVVLIGVAGTQKGNNMQAVQIHLECLELIYDKERGFIYHRMKI
jgi:hypothetical protein